MEKIVNGTNPGQPPLEGRAEQLIHQIRAEREYGINDDDQIIVCRPTDEDKDDWPDGEHCQWGDNDLHICVEGDGAFYVEANLTLEEVEKYFLDPNPGIAEEEEVYQETEGRK